MKTPANLLQTIKILDEHGNETGESLCVYRLANGAIVGIDESYIATEEPVFSPYDKGKELEIIEDSEGESDPNEKILFQWRDKTGRGFKNKISLAAILEEEDASGYSNDSLHEWAREAEEGDEFENRTDKYTRI